MASGICINLERGGDKKLGGGCNFTAHGPWPKNKSASITAGIPSGPKSLSGKEN